MNKKIGLVISVSVIFVIAGILSLEGFLSLNSFRIARSDEYYRSFKQSSSLNNKLISILISNTLSPSDEKKLIIADLYFSEGDYRRGDFYLSRVKSEDGFVAYAQSALETGKINVFEQYFPKIDDPGIKEELILFKDFSSGKIDSLSSLPSSPETYLGNVLLAINQSQYEDIPSRGLLGNKIQKELIGVQGKNNQELRVAKTFMDNNQPFVADFIIKRQIASFGGNISAYLFLCQISDANNDYKKFLNYFNLALGLEPENIELYRYGLEVSRKNNDLSYVGFLESKIKYLEKINR